MTALSPDRLISCLVAFSILLLFFHIHAESGSFQLLQSWCLQSLQYVKVQAVRLHQNTEALYEKEAMQVRRMLDEARVQHFKSVARCGLVFLALVIVTEAACSFRADNALIGVWSWHLIVYATGLLVAHSHIQWTPMKMAAVTTLVNCMMLARTCIIADQGIWFLHSDSRAIFRLFMGILDMDHCWVAMWNLLFLFANVIKGLRMLESVPALHTTVSDLVLHEVFVCLLVWIASYIAQMWVTDCVKTGFEASASRIDKTMTDHLLSAFCDAQVKLGSNLQLLGPHEKLSRILLLRSPAEPDLLDGTSFLDYVATADKARFEAFIEACSAPPDRCASHSSADLYERPKTLPSALHVHLRDSSGRHIPVSIFHSAALIANGESHHLMGICVGSSEEFTDPQQAPRDFAEQSHCRIPSKNRSSSLSSKSSSSSSKSKRSVHLIDIPLIDSVTVMFDPFNWSISKVCWKLSDAGCKVLTIDDCMVQPDGLEFRRWVQDQISMYFLPENENGDQDCHAALYGPVALNLPGIFGRKKQIVISSKSAWLDFEGLDEVDDELEYAVVSLHLDGVQQMSDTGRLQAAMTTISEELQP